MSATSEAAALQQNNLQLLRKRFRAQEFYNAVNTTLSSGEFGQRDA